jgi:predicted N-acetyltransferase YhbS
MKQIMIEDRFSRQGVKYKTLDKNSGTAVASLFTSVFTTSEGEEEGRLIGSLALELSSNIDNEEIFCFGAYEEETLIAAIFFSRLRFSDPILVYMLAPVSVSTESQGKGVGKALIEYGLNELKHRSVAVAITYGDPSFYSKVGFEPLSEHTIKAPVKLSMPEGWLGRSLTNGPIPIISERPTCVKAFNDPAYW